MNQNQNTLENSECQKSHEPIIVSSHTDNSSIGETDGSTKNEPNQEVTHLIPSHL